MSYPSETCGCGRTDGCRNCRPITINEVVAAEYPKSIEAALTAERKAHAETKARLEKAEAACAELREISVRLAYEIEGGNRWPVDWDEETCIMPALSGLKEQLKKMGVPVPEWIRKGAGWERAHISQRKP